MNDPWTELGQERRVTKGFIGALLRTYGERGRKALKAIEESRVKRYLDFFVVVGRGDEYVVEGEFCSCGDFLYRGKECSHIIAVRIARQTGEYEQYRLWYYPSLQRR